MQPTTDAVTQLKTVWINFAGLGCLVLSLSACVTAAPTPRAAFGGMPGHVSAGKLEFGGNVTLLPPVAGTLGPNLSFALDDRWQLDLGGSFGEMAMGYAGANWHRRKPLGENSHIVLELDLGLGAGTGGRCDQSGDSPHCAEKYEQLSWDERPAVGGYAGAGVGFQIRWFSVFARIRDELVDAKGIPTSNWLGGVVGVGFDFGQAVHFYVAGGRGKLFNRLYETGFPVLEVGLAFRYDPFQR